MLWYKPESKTVMLTQVPEYPVIREKLNEDASAPQPDNSIYNEDGSLQVLTLCNISYIVFLHFLCHFCKLYIF